MKEYRLLAWPDLPAEYKHTAHTRALTELSMRHMSLGQLVEVSGLRKRQARTLVDLLDGQGLIAERDASAHDSFFDSLWPRSWLKRSTPVDPQARR